jgi:hypothetical protein
MRNLRKQKPKYDELFVLRLDSSHRPRGARFAKLEDKIASASIDMKCRALFHQPRSVAALCMALPVGRLRGGKLITPRIRRTLYDEILMSAQFAERRLDAEIKKARARDSIQIKQIIDKANAVLTEF